jgi:DNA repair ATPase RecN
MPGKYQDCIDELMEKIAVIEGNASDYSKQLTDARCENAWMKARIEKLESKAREIDLAKERVRKTMRHYFKLAVTSSGCHWDSDCTAEIDNMVDDIFDTMKGL